MSGDFWIGFLAGFVAGFAGIIAFVRGFNSKLAEVRLDLAQLHTRQGVIQEQITALDTMRRIFEGPSRER